MKVIYILNVSEGLYLYFHFNTSAAQRVSVDELMFVHLNVTTGELSKLNSSVVFQYLQLGQNHSICYCILLNVLHNVL